MKFEQAAKSRDVSNTAREAVEIGSCRSSAAFCITHFHLSLGDSGMATSFVEIAVRQRLYKTCTTTAGSLSRYSAQQNTSRPIEKIKSNYVNYKASFVYLRYH